MLTHRLSSTNDNRRIDKKKQYSLWEVSSLKVRTSGIEIKANFTTGGHIHTTKLTSEQSSSWRHCFGSFDWVGHEIAQDLSGKP